MIFVDVEGKMQRLGIDIDDLMRELRARVGDPGAWLAVDVIEHLQAERDDLIIERNAWHRAAEAELRARGEAEDKLDAANATKNRYAEALEVYADPSFYFAGGKLARQTLRQEDEQ
jgi:hypothetical protein